MHGNGKFMHKIAAISHTEDVQRMLRRLCRVIPFLFLLNIPFIVSSPAQVDEKKELSHLQAAQENDSDVALPTGEFTVQVGAFSRKANAERLGRRFQNSGWSVDVYKNVLDRKKIYYLVWIGTYASLDEAHAQQALIEQKYRIRGVIRQRIAWQK